MWNQKDGDDLSRCGIKVNGLAHETAQKTGANEISYYLCSFMANPVNPENLEILSTASSPKNT
jgi:hypothetical protein